MDHSSFDRIARLLGGAASRRAGLRAALGGLLGLAALDGADAGRNKDRGRGKGKDKDKDKNRVRPEGPCGNGSRKDNACTKDKQCCTGLCNKKAGKKNLDGKGRCRCVKKNGKCKEDRNCCSRKGQELACVDGVCTGGGGLIPTSEACTEGGTACEDPNASCTTYDEGSDGPAGTYCLLPFLEKTCAKAADCGCNSCYGGTCLTCNCGGCPDATLCASPKVCASGCPHATVQAGIDAAASGDTVTIGEGAYQEDVTISGKDLYLLGCPKSGEVIIKNKTLLSRTIDVTDGSDLTIGDIVIQGYYDDNNYGGGINTTGGDFCIGLRSRVENCSRVDNDSGEGGGMSIGQLASQTSPPTRQQVRVTDAVIIQNNIADSYGGGAFFDSYGDAVVDGHVLVTNNTCKNDCYGAGLVSNYASTLTIRGNVRITENHSDSYAGGVMYYCGGTGYKPAGRAADLLIGGNVEITNNTVGTPTKRRAGGGGVNFDYCDPEELFILEDNAVISGNSVIGSDAGGGGVWFSNGSFTMRGNARITGNVVRLGENQPTARGGGMYVEGNDLASSGSFSISGNAVVSGNSAEEHGGGVYFSVKIGNFSMAGNAVITENTATGQGGGVYFYNDDNTLTFADSAAITGNTAAQGGGIWIDTNNNPMTTTGYNSPAISGNTPNQCENSNGVCP